MKSPVESAFRNVPRTNFLPPDNAGNADMNMPLPIGFGQTNSQPETVQLMLEWLDVEVGNEVLDVGSGSGWTSALLAHLTGPKGHVTAVEIVPELVEFGHQNCIRLGIRNVSFHEAQKHIGWPDTAPYDRILVSAAASNLPTELIDQLRPSGRLVIPIRDSIWVIEKDAQGAVSQTEKPGFVFVPLIENDGLPEVTSKNLHLHKKELNANARKNTK
jgi:protein-L-isoaspartate(D-aspartate) O-methyltransferase